MPNYIGIPYSVAAFFEFSEYATAKSWSCNSHTERLVRWVLWSAGAWEPHHLARSEKNPPLLYLGPHSKLNGQASRGALATKTTLRRALAKSKKRREMQKLLALCPELCTAIAEPCWKPHHLARPSEDFLLLYLRGWILRCFLTNFMAGFTTLDGDLCFVIFSTWFWKSGALFFQISKRVFWSGLQN